MRSNASWEMALTCGFVPSGATVATLESFGLEELTRSPSLMIQPSLPRMMDSWNTFGWTKRHVVVPSEFSAFAGPHDSSMASTPVRSPVSRFRNPASPYVISRRVLSVDLFAVSSGTQPFTGATTSGNAFDEASKSHTCVAVLSQASHRPVERSGQYRRIGPMGALDQPWELGRVYALVPSVVPVDGHPVVMVPSAGEMRVLPTRRSPSHQCTPGASSTSTRHSSRGLECEAS